MKTIEVDSSEQLRQLFDAFDELGMTHRYSEELGEFDIKIGDMWVMFQVNPQALADEDDADRWAEDAYAVADYYWRQ